MHLGDYISAFFAFFCHFWRIYSIDMHALTTLCIFFCKKIVFDYICDYICAEGAPGIDLGFRFQVSGFKCSVNDRIIRR